MTSAPASGQPFAGDRPQGERVAPGPGLTREAARFPTRRVCGGEGGRRPSTRCGPSVRSLSGGGLGPRGSAAASLGVLRARRGPGVSRRRLPPAPSPLLVSAKARLRGSPEVRPDVWTRRGSGRTGHHLKAPGRHLKTIGWAALAPSLGQCPSKPASLGMTFLRSPGEGFVLWRRLCLSLQEPDISCLQAAEKLQAASCWILWFSSVLPSSVLARSCFWKCSPRLQGQ
ncbi:uncharacterized protein LOC119869796 isoform X1 [Canis lupus familiaris]|uniref:uncharacterized protein LOC119869796 isoform X1 n=1 Tax=Canis lupus familiaris TaxID=9615 RepID=UPI0018F68485|nr:uncharacterized protein LOC119869796 isoform X1 [Canis lupus familiaris]